MKSCKQCGSEPQLMEKKQAYTGAVMFFYSCPRCGYKTGYGVPGKRPNGITVTAQQAVEIAGRKWEAETTLSMERDEIRSFWSPTGEEDPDPERAHLYVGTAHKVRKQRGANGHG